MLIADAICEAVAPSTTMTMVRLSADAATPRAEFTIWTHGDKLESGYYTGKQPMACHWRAAPGTNIKQILRIFRQECSRETPGAPGSVGYR